MERYTPQCLSSVCQAQIFNIKRTFMSAAGEMGFCSTLLHIRRFKRRLQFRTDLNFEFFLPQPFFPTNNLSNTCFQYLLTYLPFVFSVRGVNRTRDKCVNCMQSNRRRFKLHGESLLRRLQSSGCWWSSFSGIRMKSGRQLCCIVAMGTEKRVSISRFRDSLSLEGHATVLFCLEF